MSAVIIPPPGPAVHIWQDVVGWFGVDTVRRNVNPDFPPEASDLFEDHDAADYHVTAIPNRIGLPVVSHLGSF